MKILKIFKYLYLDFRRFLFTLSQGKKMLVEKDEAERRLNICRNCDKINVEFKLGNYRFERCGICGCFLKAKTKLAFEECPDNPPKW